MTGLAPLPDAEWGDEVRWALSPLLATDRAKPARRREPAGTLVRHPALTRAFLSFNAYLLRDSALSPRLREMALLRIVHRRSCGYLWRHHVPIARRAGLTAAEIDAIGRGDAADPVDRLVLRAVDDLDEHHAVAADTWAALGEVLGDRECMDLVFVVGAYTTLALAVNTFGIEDERR